MKWIEIIIACVIATLIVAPAYKRIDKKFKDINARFLAKFLAGWALFFASYLLADLLIFLFTGEKYGLIE